MGKTNFCIEDKCFKEITPQAKRCRYHADKQHSIKISGKNNPLYKHGKSKIESFCVDCNKKLSINAFFYGNKRCNLCANIFTGKDKLGRNNPRFGITPDHTKRVKYKSFTFRSQWELAYAKYLDKNKIKWKYEFTRFDLGNSTYTPDFYLPETNEYIEIKGFWQGKARSKYLKFRRRYSNIKISICNKKKLIKLNLINRAGKIL